jgi:hypothetical protein
LDFKSQKVSSDLEQPFEEVIVIPPNLVRQQEAEDSIGATAKDDQGFLSNYLAQIEQEEKEAEASPHKEDGMIKSLRKIGKVEDVFPQSPAKDSTSLTAKPSTPSLASSASLLSTQTPPRRIFSVCKNGVGVPDDGLKSFLTFRSLTWKAGTSCVSQDTKWSNGQCYLGQFLQQFA